METTLDLGHDPRTFKLTQYGQELLCKIDLTGVLFCKAHYPHKLLELFCEFVFFEFVFMVVRNP